MSEQRVAYTHTFNNFRTGYREKITVLEDDTDYLTLDVVSWYVDENKEPIMGSYDGFVKTYHRNESDKMMRYIMIDVTF